MDEKKALLAEYERVHQTWDLVCKSRCAEQAADAPPAPRPALLAAAVQPAQTTLRQRVQVARIARKWSVAEVAARVPHCTAVQLAAYEGGREVLPAALEAALKRELELT